MPTDIVQGLFGDTPYGIQMAQKKALDASAYQHAQLDPLQRAAMSMYQGGGMLGGAGAEAMGMVNPQVEQAKATEQAFTGIDTSNPDSILQRAQQVQDPRLKMRLTQYAQQMKAQQQEMDLKKAHAKYYEQAGGKTSASALSQLAAKQAIARNDAMKWALNAGYKGQDLLDFVDAQVQKVTDTWNATTGTQQATQQSVQGEKALSPSTSISGNLKITQEQKDAMIQDATSRGDAEAVSKIQELPVTKQISLPQSKADVAGAVKLAETQAANNPAALSGGAAARKGGETGVEIYTKQFHQADAASKVIPKVDALINQLKTGDVTTGVGADLRIGLSRIQALLGGKDAIKNATDSQIADVMMGSEVFPLIQSLGIGARGMDTPAEREFLRKVLTGELSLEKGTLLRMAELRKEAAKRDIDRWDSQVDKGDLDKYFENVGIPKTKFGQQAQQNPTQAKRIKFDAKGNRVQ